MLVTCSGSSESGQGFLQSPLYPLGKRPSHRLFKQDCVSTEFANSNAPAIFPKAICRHRFGNRNFEAIPLLSNPFDVEEVVGTGSGSRSSGGSKLIFRAKSVTFPRLSSEGSCKRCRCGGSWRSGLWTSSLLPCSFDSEDCVERSPKSRISTRGFTVDCHRSSATLPPKPSRKKRDKKWKYGGSLPSILHNLDAGNSIEEILNLWVGKLSSKEQTVILKEQRDWRLALRIFRWMRAQADYAPNVIHYNVVFRILGRAHQWDELRLLWIEMGKDGVSPTNNTYGMLIDVYGKAGLVKEALLWLKHMTARGIFPDEVTMNTSVRILKDAGEYDRAERFFKDWCSGHLELGKLDLNSIIVDSDSGHISPKHFLLTELFKAGRSIPLHEATAGAEAASHRKPLLAATYNTLIDLYGKAGRLGDASNVFAEMLRSGVPPDAFTFNTMIHICGSHGHLSEAEALLGKMEEKRISPDTKTFNIFLSLYGNVGNIDAVLSFYRKFKEAGLCPDVVTHRIILQILCERKMIEEVENVIHEMGELGACIHEQSLPVVMKMYVEVGMLDRSKCFFDKHCTHGVISSKTYAAIIDVYAEKGFWAEAENVFFERRNVGRNDVVEYNVMIKAYGKSKLYDKALSLFGSMKINGIWPDECTYNSLIQMLSGGEMLDSAMDVLAKMRAAGLKPHCTTFCSIITGCTRSGRLDDAVGVFREMKTAGVEPNEVVYGCLIDAFAGEGKVEEALNYLGMMEASGLAANQIIYTSLIKAYGKAGYWKEALELYEKMNSMEGGPDVVASNAMIDLCVSLDMVHEADSIFSRLKETGRADMVSFTTMMCLYKNLGMFDQAIGVAEEMQHLGLLSDCASFGIAMSSYVAKGQLTECAELLHQMLEKKILPVAETFKVLFTVLKKGGMPIESVTQLHSVYEDGKPYARKAIITSVYSVVGLHDYALKSCELLMEPGLELETSMCNVAIYAYGACGKVEKALNIFMRMQDHGLEPDIVTFIFLVGCYGKAGMLEGVKRIYSQMKFGTIDLNQSLFRAAVLAYREAGRRDLAEMVDQEMKFSFLSEEIVYQETGDHNPNPED